MKSEAEEGKEGGRREGVTTIEQILMPSLTKKAHFKNKQGFYTPTFDLEAGRGELTNP